MSNSKLALNISPTLFDHPRANLVPWKLAINRAARGVFAEWDAFGFLFAACDEALWALLNTPPGVPLRARPDFPDLENYLDMYFRNLFTREAITPPPRRNHQCNVP